METDVEETLNKVGVLIKDDQERNRRFDQLMDKLSVPLGSGLSLTAIEQLSSEEKQQAEQDLVRIFQQVDGLSATGDGNGNQMNSLQMNSLQMSSTKIVNERSGESSTVTDKQARKAQRPLRMRGLTI